MDTTVPSTRRVSAPAHAKPPVPALVMVWSAEEPWRVGEVAQLFDGGPWFLGRHADAIDELTFVRQRPHDAVITGPLSGKSISRKQLAFERVPSGTRVRNVGTKKKLRVNGKPAEEAVVRDGDVVEILGHYVLHVTTRPHSIGAPFEWHAFPFGEADDVALVGESAPMWALRRAIATIAPLTPHVLVHGPTGAGKELVVRAIHALSGRRGMLVARNATTFPPGVIDAELWGCVKNYLGPNMPERIGLVGAAEGGTLFLDEIGEIAPELQAHLLRLLDSGAEYARLGETITRRADVRVICATNRQPQTLKLDFLPRIELEVQLPSLDERREDIPLLLRHLVIAMAARNSVATRFIKPIGSRTYVDVDPDFIVALCRRRYPTNVREISGLLWKSIQCSPESRLLAPPSAETRDPTLDEGVNDDNEDGLDKDAVGAALERCHGNVTRAAETLGISRHALTRLMKKHGLER